MKLVAAAVIEQNGVILLARRAPGQKLAGLWEFPGGKVENGESLEECLRRELAEELQISCSIGNLVAESDYHDSEGAIRLLALRATILSGEISLTVHDEVCWLRPKDLESVPLAPADIPIARFLRESAHGI
ncbi:(deoxy)nucleoside triphosphate pyrophosphohydrolase [Burkholderiaceae bacterium FT117]|uniref:(deoxy)nucleoside triphosphate pyrophosphohydrolase n=1 Tax=Zeimonas sediminis TaxID=2944268 RepID=UPI0023431F85|nr:(deoxy)nucleoside triphosphate pyrophosphohydrolase [Zeimonas sediminis]MCM5570060.1 (deoxy)nucleoside triphosphate pyrophosphohydrolase [Zeimonas sediminis]